MNFVSPLLNVGLLKLFMVNIFISLILSNTANQGLFIYLFSRELVYHKHKVPGKLPKANLKQLD